MPASKRARACDACHIIKIKCELGTNGGPGPCNRCIRLGEECVITPPKRQKDRVAELEAQVEALTRILHSQHIQPPVVPSQASQDYSESSSLSSPSVELPVPTKKRRLEYEPWNPNDFYPVSTTVERLDLDFVVPRELQEQVLRKYLDEFVPAFPLIPITGDYSYEALRKDRPILLQAIVYAASPGLVHVEAQEGIAKILLNLFASAAMAEGRKSIELVQAMQLALLHYRSPKHHTPVSAFQLIDLAAGMVEDIGIGGSPFSPSSGLPNTGQDIDLQDARRAWLICHLLSASMGLFMRKPPSRVWSEEHDNLPSMLEYANDALPSDRMLCQYVRAERLCERIASQLNFYDFTTANDVSELVNQLTMQGLQDLITDWKAQIPPALRCPGLTFWEHAANLYLHEPVLHTLTNKQSFAAPFLAERLSVTDFPAPVVTQEHIASIHALKAAGQALLDIFSRFDISTTLSLPALLFSSRVLYAVYILVKLYVATTAVGNTFGAYLDPESLEVEHYLGTVVQIAATIKQIDDRCGQMRILGAASRLREWFVNYRTTHVDQGFQQSFGTSLAPTSASSELPSIAEPAQMNWNSFVFDSDTFAYGLGLDELFADPPLATWSAGFSKIPEDHLYAPSIRFASIRHP